MGSRAPWPTSTTCGSTRWLDEREQITCPTFVSNTARDESSASAPQLVAELRCEKQFVTFTDAEGAGDHCEQAARLQYHARMFGWLDEMLARA